MPRKIREIRADLRGAGFSILRQEGSHQTWSHPEAPDLRLTVSGNDGDDAKPYQERQLREKLDALRAHRKQRRPTT